MAPKTRSKRRTPPPPSLRALNPEYSLRKCRLEDIEWFPLAGFTGDGTVMIRASWPNGIGRPRLHEGNIIRGLELLRHIEAEAPHAPRANFGAPFPNPRCIIRDVHTINRPGAWLLKPDVDLRTFPESFHADADRVELCTRYTWRKAASPAATWRAVYLGSKAPAVPWCFALVDADGRVAAFCAPLRKD